MKVVRPILKRLNVERTESDEDLVPTKKRKTNADTVIETVTTTVTKTVIPRYRNSCRSFTNDFTRCWMNSFLCLMCHALDLNPNAWNQMTESEFGSKLQDYKEISVHNTSALVVDYVRNKVAPTAIAANGWGDPSCIFEAIQNHKWEPFQRLLKFQIHTTKTFDKPCGHSLSVSTQCCLKIPYPTKHNTNLMDYISTWTSGSAGEVYNVLRYCGMCYDSVHQARDANAIGCSTLTRLYSPPQSGTLLVELTWHLQQTDTAPRLKVDVTRPVQIAFADGAKKNYEIVNFILYDGSHYTNRQSTPDGWKEVNNHFVEDVRLCNIGDFPRAVIRHLLLREASDQ